MTAPKNGIVEWAPKAAKAVFIAVEEPVAQELSEGIVRLARRVVELEDELRENEGVIAVWRRRAEFAEAERDAPTVRRRCAGEGGGMSDDMGSLYEDLQHECIELRAERDALAEELLDIRGSFPIPKERRLAVARAIYALAAKGEGK